MQQILIHAYLNNRGQLIKNCMRRYCNLITNLSNRPEPQPQSTFHILKSFRVFKFLLTRFKVYDRSPNLQTFCKIPTRTCVAKIYTALTLCALHETCTVPVIENRK